MDVDLGVSSDEEASATVLRGIAVKDAVDKEGHRRKPDIARSTAGIRRVSLVVLEGALEERRPRPLHCKPAADAVRRGQSVGENQRLEGDWTTRDRRRVEKPEDVATATAIEHDGLSSSGTNREASRLIGNDEPARGCGIGASGQLDDSAVGNLINRLLKG